MSILSGKVGHDQVEGEQVAKKPRKPWRLLLNPRVLGSLLTFLAALLGLLHALFSATMGLSV